MVGLCQERAQVLPDEVVQGATRDVAGGAALALRATQGVAASLAHVVRLPTGRHRPRRRAQPATATADEGTEQIGVVGVVAGAALLVLRELLLDVGKDLE